MKHEAIQHCGGVIWSVQARILPMVAKPPNLFLSCARSCTHAPIVNVPPLCARFQCVVSLLCEFFTFANSTIRRCYASAGFLQNVALFCRSTSLFCLLEGDAPPLFISFSGSLASVVLYRGGGGFAWGQFRHR